MLKSGVLAHVILTRHCLKSQINLGIRIQEVDKDLGRKMASETLVRQLRVGKMAKKPKKYEPPEPEAADTAHLVTRGILSFIPGASELYEWFLQPPLEMKLELWRTQVGEALRQLEANSDVDLEQLQTDDRFISIVMQATAIAMRNYQDEKWLALHNVILNSAKAENLEEDLQFVFIRLIDELTPSHLLLLSFFVENKRTLASIHSYSDLYGWYEQLHPKRLSQEVFRLLCNDLSSRGLMRISPDFRDFRDIYQGSKLLLEDTKEDLPRIIVPEVAEQFLAFISKDKSSVA